MGDKRTVVIAMDGSKYADYAFESVMLAGEPVLAREMEGIMEQEENEAKQLVHTLGNKMRAAGVTGKVKSVAGNPGEGVVRVAQEEGASAIVTGSRGMGTIRRTLLGSVSDFILHHSHVPVIICHKDNL